MITLYKNILNETQPCAWTTFSIGYYDTEGFIHWTPLKECLITYHNESGHESIWLHTAFPFNYTYKLDGKCGQVDGRSVYGVEHGLFLYLEHLRDDTGLDGLFDTMKI